MSGSEPALRADARRNRDAVLEAAVALLSRRPDASMLDVAGASGLGRTTVYRHFPSRGDLVTALYEQVADEAAAMVRDAISVAGEGAAAVLRRLADGCVALGARWTFLNDQRPDAEMVEAEAAARAWIAEAAARGELRPGVDADWLLASVNGLSRAAIGQLQAGVAAEAAIATRLGDTLVAAFVAG
jgi:AcrR family transcriptional regulator